MRTKGELDSIFQMMINDAGSFAFDCELDGIEFWIEYCDGLVDCNHIGEFRRNREGTIGFPGGPRRRRERRSSRAGTIGFCGEDDSCFDSQMMESADREYVSWDDYFPSDKDSVQLLSEELDYIRDKLKVVMDIIRL